MRKILYIMIVILIIISLSFASCSSLNYENIVDTACKALECGNKEMITSLLDKDSIQRWYEALYDDKSHSVTQINGILNRYYEQQKLSETFTELKDNFGDNYIVKHGALVPDKEKIDLADLKTLRKLTNRNESSAQRDFINSFVDSLSQVVCINTTLIVQKRGSNVKNIMNITFNMYCLSGKWYLDYTDYPDIETPNILAQINTALSVRGQNTNKYPPA